MWYNQCMKRENLRKQAIRLRSRGMTYIEVQHMLGVRIPKSTLSYWFNGVVITASGRKRLARSIAKQLKITQTRSLQVRRQHRNEYFDEIIQRVKYLRITLRQRDVALIALAMLYLGEGSKGLRQAKITFGNSDSAVITLFLKLLRSCFVVDEKKFRCTLQCRADQSIETLERFWSSVTDIPRSQFYQAQIDPRTLGKPSRKKEYRGVCRIDYLSAKLFHEVIKIMEVLLGP